MRFSAGFTLIELLVVISIIGVLSVVGYANFKNFGNSQIAKKGAGEVQTFLRLAQSNASTSTLCNGQPAQGWSLKFTEPSKVELHCDPTDYKKNTLNLENATISFDCSIHCSLTNPIFKYAIGSGSLTISPTSNELGASDFVIITITNSKDGSKESFKITKQGAINVQ